MEAPPHRIFLDPTHFAIARELSIPLHDESHDVGIRQPVGEVCPMLLFWAFLPPSNIYSIRILPSLVRLEVFRVRRVDMGKLEQLANRTDVTGVQDRTRSRLGRASRVGRQHMLATGE